MRSFEQKLQDIRDSIDEVMMESIERLDSVRELAPKDFSMQSDLWETYSELRIAKNILERTK